MQAASTETLPRAETTCPTCGAQAERGQLVCLECGGRIALDYRRPPSWKLPLALIVVVLVAAGVGAGFGLHAISNDADKEVAKTRTGKRVSSAPGSTSQRTAKPKTTTRKTRATGPVGGAGGGWPAGRDGYTVILLAATDRASARNFAQRVKGAGVVGVLRSDDYSSLQPGFWLAFSGIYRTRPQAQRAADRLRATFRGTFPQFVNGSKPTR